VLLLLPTQAMAQTPIPQPQVPLDLTAVTLPTIPSGHCLALEPGELTVAVQLVGDGHGAPVRFTFDGYRGDDPDAMLAFAAAYAPTVRRTVLTGGTYCYGLENQGPVPPNATDAQIRLHWQAVTLRLTLTPLGVVH
jgi:hypothetical protein